MLFVVENNLYGASTTVKMVVKVPHISDRAAAYGMPGVHRGRKRRAGGVRGGAGSGRTARAQGKGPTLLELVTYRITGHSRRDPCLYQPEEEKKQAVANEPIGRFGRSSSWRTRSATRSAWMRCVRR